MGKLIKFPKGLIEYKGELITPEEFAEKVNIKDFEIVENVEETWFEKVLREMDENKQ